SYDSSKEDAQNPWPDFDDSPPGKKESPPESKRTFQRGKAGKQPLRTDSMQTVVETPPAKLKRAITDQLTGSTSKKVKHALTRPQTVDKKNTLERQASAQAAQRKLEHEFEDVEETQRDDPKEPAHFQDKKIVDAIVVRKQTDEYLKKTEIRDHPDCPGLVQYLVLVDEEHTDEDADEIVDMFRAEVITSLSRVIRETNDKISELSGMSKNIQAALRKDLNDAISQLTTSRADLQSALDASEEPFHLIISLCFELRPIQPSYEETRITSSTESAKALISKLQQQVLSYGKKKSFTSK
ncbi:unnamed protein product, partial [Symbiodinium necroappetens]